MVSNKGKAPKGSRGVVLLRVMTKQDKFMTLKKYFVLFSAVDTLLILVLVIQLDYIKTRLRSRISNVKLG